MKDLKRYISFTALILLYILNLGMVRLSKYKIIKYWTIFYSKALLKLDSSLGSITKIGLIDLAIRNMQAKKTRTIITVGGMAVGIGSIVFLVSIGYGLQNLVISRVANLNEMKQADVSPQAGGKVLINDKTLSDLKDISNVKMVLPLISVVGEVNYQNSMSDMAVYGVTSDYLKQSAIKPIQGKIFDNNNVSFIPAPGVAGVSTGSEISFSINSGVWAKVRESAKTTTKILGYTKDTGLLKGEETSDSKWVKSSFLLWQKTGCNFVKDGDCDEGGYKVMRDSNNFQVQKEGYTSETNITIVPINDVLGVSTTIPWVDIASQSALTQTQTVKTVDITSVGAKEAVINIAALKILGITESQAVGKKFNVSYVVTGDLLVDATQKVQSTPTEYTIVGVIPDDKTPLFYVPFTDLRSLGVSNYSQVKVVVNNQSALPKVRRQIEAMGFVTRSVADTVSQINSLFATAKIILALLGMVALGVAALGMFNTLTVSLLERTREVGLMKAMGMKSSEVQELFLTESMIMGLFGGILGIIAGFIIGKILGFILSIFSVFKGAGYVDVSSIPILFVLVVILLSVIVGATTGIYPASRAKKISALDALRYE